MVGFAHAFDLLWLIGTSILNVQLHDAEKYTSYEPVHLAFKIFEPKLGADETLSPIVFIHGLTASTESWGDIPQRVADASNRKVYAFDARNHGESEYSEHFSFDLNVEDLLHFLDSHNISKAVLVGHSMGGATASYAALKKPERIEKVFIEDMIVKKIPQALLDSGLPVLHMRKESTLHMPSTLSFDEAIEFSNEYMNKQIPYGSPLHGRFDDIRRNTVSIKRKPDGTYDVNYNFDVIIRAMKDADSLLSEPKGQYDGPTYFIYGSQSPLAVYTEEEAIKKHFPNAEFIEITEAGHNIHLEYPDEFIAKVLNYL